MANKSRIVWTGNDQLVRRMAEYGDKVKEVTVALANYWAPVLETYAKDHHVWQDQTGNATQGLQGLVEEINRDIIAIVLKHGVDYGIHLETRWQGRYAIIEPTLEAHYEPIMRMLREIFD